MSLRRIGAVVVALLTLPSVALANSAAIKTASKGVQVGTEGAWKDAAPGMPIADSDFVKIPENASATIVLPDNSTKEFAGKVVIPGRRLASAKVSAGAMIWFSQGLQKTAASVVGEGAGTTKASGITKAGTPTPKAMVYEGEHEDLNRDLTKAQAQLDAGKFDTAATTAGDVYKNAASDDLQTRRAYLIAGQAFAGQASYHAALKALDHAAAACEPGDPGAEYRAQALLARGQVETQLGDDAKAKADFTDALTAAPDQKATVTQAKFLLGVLAVTGNDPKTARSWFDQIQDSKDLYAAGMAMLQPTK